MPSRKGRTDGNTTTNSTKTNTTEKFRFRTEHFYQLLDSQQYRCPITGRELTPQNTVAEHRQPLRKGGMHELANIILVDQEVSKLKRYMNDDEVVRLAADIISTLGAKYGYKLTKAK